MAGEEVFDTEVFVNIAAFLSRCEGGDFNLPLRLRERCVTINFTFALWRDAQRAVWRACMQSLSNRESRSSKITLN